MQFLAPQPDKQPYVKDATRFHIRLFCFQGLYCLNGIWREELGVGKGKGVPRKKGWGWRGMLNGTGNSRGNRKGNEKSNEKGFILCTKYDITQLCRRSSDG